MITLENLGVYLPQGFLFKGVNLQINRGERIGLVGKNGAGKSTLLKILSNKQQPSEGKIHLSKGITLGFLTQDIVINSTESVYEFLNKSNGKINEIRTRLEEINDQLIARTDYESDSYMSLLDELSELNHAYGLFDGHTWEERIVTTLKGLGFQDAELDRSLNSFSGGWKMRAELARILVNQPDILLLDEPTNHLDIISISWLETYLQKFEGIVILISHDRLFLDNVTKRTLEISLGKILDFPYNYSKYKALREEDLDRLEQAKKQQDKDIKQTEMLIDKFRAKSSKAAFAQSLMKKLERTERIEIEKDPTSRMRLTFPLSIQPGKWVLELEQMGKTYGEKLIFKNINITVGRGEKIAFLGANGVGKSTLLKRIIKEIEGDGTVKYGHNVNIAYFAQNQAEDLDTELTVFETVDNIAVGDIRKDLRTILGTFLFTGEDVNKKVKVLSGGERTRLALCQLLLSPSNFLILDEPTNHLDIASKEVLKQALINYEGTFIIVSHDREFLDGLTNRIWEIYNQTLKIHHYTVQEFLKKKTEEQKEFNQSEKLVKTLSVHREEKPAPQNTNANEKEIKRIEKEISELELRIEEMNVILAELDYSDEMKATSTLSEYEQLKSSLDEKIAVWENLIG
ncbi:MAG: ABC-F family ATP-binding cassette domain-containing protein [Bacteroidetes bacterium]|nr:ABC-F family ATP-binding cassette domain-containing protein [Bacteroidota bacterium]